jgi:hypothetical protein
MAKKVIDCDVVVQAGHENTPDTMTGGEGPLGKEIDWTPVVAKRSSSGSAGGARSHVTNIAERRNSIGPFG